jgi:hypothetical protein
MYAAISTRSNPFPLAISKAGAIAALVVGSISLLAIIILVVLVSTHNCCTSRQAENEDEDAGPTGVMDTLVQYGLAAAVPPPPPSLALRPQRPAATNA